MARKSRKNKKTVSKVHEDYAKGVMKQLEMKTKEIIFTKNHLLSLIDQACDCVMGEYVNVLDVRLCDMGNTSEESKDFQGVELPAQFLVPSAAKPPLENNNSNSTVKALENTYSTTATKPIPQYFITPKVNPFSPISMLRLPQQGEFAVSAAGSPLQVTCTASETASMNIPLKNGKVMSVLPKPGVNTDVIHANLDPSVKQQLETLRKALSQILDE